MIPVLGHVGGACGAYAGASFPLPLIPLSYVRIPPPAHERTANDRFSDLLLPFGERIANGRMVSPDEVDNGLACGCVCPKCRRRLIAKHSDIVRYHFAHESDSVCVGAFETSAHLLAKQIIADEGQVFTPEVVAEYRAERRPVMD